MERFELRKEFNIHKPIETLNKRYKYIDGFINIQKNTKNYENMYKDIYSEIIEFNDLMYFNRFNYAKKLFICYRSMS